MSALKKIFGAGNSQDDEVMYQTNDPPSTAIENTDRAIQSERDLKPGAAGQAETGLSSSNVQSQTAGTTAATAGTAGAAASGLTFASDHPSQGTTTTAAPAGDETSGLTSASGAAGAAGAGAAGAEASGLTFAKQDEKPPVVGGSMADASAYTSKSDNVSGGVPNASALTFADNREDGKPPVVGGSMADSSAYMGSQTKEDDNRGVSAGRALKPEEGETKFDTDDISKATYTERSFPLASGDSTGSHSTGEAAAAGGVFGATIVGAGAYAAASRNDDQPATTTGKDELHPEQADSAGRIAPGHVPGEFPNEGVDPHPGRDIAAGTAVAAGGGGAGGAAVSTYDQKSGGLAGGERDRFFGRPQSSPPVSPPQSPEATQSEFKQDETHYGRDAAAAGGLTLAAGAVGAGAYEAERTHQTNIASVIDPGVDDKREKEGASDPRIHQTEPTKVQETETHYGRDAAAVGAVTAVGAGAGYAATQGVEDHKASEPTSGHHHHHHHHKGGEEHGEKKQGFFSKVFHGHDKSQEAPIGDANPANEVQRVGEGSSMGGPAGAPTHDDNLIHLVRSDADPNEPALVIREKPGGGIETVEP